VTYSGTIRSLAGKTVIARQAGLAHNGTSSAKLARIAAEAALRRWAPNDVTIGGRASTFSR